MDAHTNTNAAQPSIRPQRDTDKLTITVLAGGPGGERDISLQSGGAVADALLSRGHDVAIDDIAPDDLGALARAVDCVFIALHGTFGEDGQVQKILDQRGLAYTGSGPECCALAMNKAAAKAKFMEAGIPTARYAVVTKDNIREAMAAWNLPVVVKPVAEGSSLCCHIVREVSQLRPALELTLEQYDQCLIEQFVPGKEITVSILGESALPMIEIRTRREFYDYEAKYVDEDTEYGFDIDLPDDLQRRIVDWSLAAHKLLGCRDFSRVDWRVDDQIGDARLLEVNVIPGLTSHSLLPKAAAHAGIEMADLCLRIVNMAIDRRFAALKGQ